MEPFETMRMMRAMRRPKPDSLPRELIEEVAPAGAGRPVSDVLRWNRFEP